jgi:DNA (cytosine-5)-methyltransferase 1
MRFISLFSGCGGLDLGFSNAGFNMIFANDNDKDVIETFELNHGLKLDTRSLINIDSKELPDSEGIVGGPPCQSWSLAGKMKGAADNRGKLFYEYLRVIRDKNPKFFLAENVPGIVSKTHIFEFKKILNEFENLGYNVSWNLLNSKDFGVPQERKRVIIVGYRSDLKKKFDFSKLKPSIANCDLRLAIGDLPPSKPAQEKNYANTDLLIPNHEHMLGDFSSMYLSRNRKRNWDQVSFTIQASGRHAPLHPSSASMKKIEKDRWVFVGNNPKYRRLSVREIARIQTFPDDFLFKYKNVSKGYKMIGNAVPVKLAEVIAKQIYLDLKN